MLPKIERVRRLIDQQQLDCELEVDGGIDPVTARQAIDAGARVLVAGSAIFGHPGGISLALDKMQGAIGQR